MPGTGFFGSSGRRAAEMRRIAYQQEWARVQRNARSAAARLAGAQEARQSGKPRLAGRLLRGLLSRRRTPPAYRAAALAELEELQAEAEQRLGDLEGRLAEFASEGPPSTEAITAVVLQLLDESAEDAAGIAAGEGAGSPTSPGDTVPSIFDAMDELLWQYETVPGLGRDLRGRVRRLRRDERYSALLKEPEAAALWELGQRHEKAEELCCAYLAYERATRLTPARSARRAEERLTRLSSDGEIEGSVARCRRLRDCHKTFQLAELLAKAGRVAQARASLEEVVALAPEDSRLHAAALEELRRLDVDG